MQECYMCGECLPRVQFARNQMNKGHFERACRDCASKKHFGALPSHNGHIIRSAVKGIKEKHDEFFNVSYSKCREVADDQWLIEKFARFAVQIRVDCYQGEVQVHGLRQPCEEAARHIMRRFDIDEDCRVNKSPWLHGRNSTSGDVGAKVLLFRSFGLSSDRVCVDLETDSLLLQQLDVWLQESQQLYMRAHRGEEDEFVPDISLRIAQVFQIKKNAKACCYNAMGQSGYRTGRNRKLLAHGTRHANMADVLQQDLKVNLSRNGMLGCGVYFADAAMKSLQYADEYEEDGVRTKWLLLSEVNVGRPDHCYNTGDLPYSERVINARGNYYFTEQKRCVGHWVGGLFLGTNPACEYSDQVTRRGHDGKKMLFNEWCVKDERLYQLRYLLKLQETQGDDEFCEDSDDSDSSDCSDHSQA